MLKFSTKNKFLIRWLRSTGRPPVSISNAHVIVPNVSVRNASMHIRCQLHIRNETVETYCLIDSGATQEFIDHRFARKHNIRTHPLNHPTRALNVDGTVNKEGIITKFAWIPITVNGRKSSWKFSLSRSLSRPTNNYCARPFSIWFLMPCKPSQIRG